MEYLLGNSGAISNIIKIKVDEPKAPVCEALSDPARSTKF